MFIKSNHHLPNMKTKSFFVQPTAAQIKKYASIREVSSDLVNEILKLEEGEAIIIRRNLIPPRYKQPRKFMKHGQEVKTRRFRSLEEAIESRITPVQLREEAFNDLNSPFRCGYSFKPFVGNDKRTRKVSLVECVEGTKIYCYPHQQRGFLPSIDVQPYDEAARVEKEGAEIVVRVPSRIKKASRYELKFSSIPVIDTKNKWGITHQISTDHDCQSKRFNIRYTYTRDKEDSRVFNFCAHEVAGYLAIINHYWTNKKNVIPLQMSQFAIPTQETIKFYEKLCGNCLIQEDKTEKPRKLNQAEKEILLWGLVYKLKHDRTFFAKGKVKEYAW